MADDPRIEPSLYWRGPPAITPAMFRLWHGSPALRRRYDLATPAGRRDYGLWFIAPEAGHGLGERTVEDARHLLFRGFVLPEAPPPWPAVSASPELCAGDVLDDWLRSGVARLPLGGGRVLAVPRAMALLWELRHDVRHHFDLGSNAGRAGFIAWCLTEGVRDGSLPCDLIPAALWRRLDRCAFTDPDAPAPPLTDLLRLLAPLYYGPAAAVAAAFPATPQSVLAVALWVCGPLRRELGWPAEAAASVADWLAAPSPLFDDAFVPITNLMSAIWSLGGDARPAADPRFHEGRVVMREWVIATGLARFGFDRAAPLAAPTATAARDRVRAAMPQSADVCLIGFRDANSGRGEDLRMTARALSVCGHPHTVIDRWPRTAGSEEPASGATPAIALIHLNADTACFDYLFLRDLGLGECYRIGYWAWELEKFPREWLASFNFVDEIWAPSRFTYDAVAPHTVKPVRLMPLAVELPAADGRMSRAGFGLPERDFVFYYGFDFRSFIARKNPQAAIAAFRRAFPRGDEPVVLLVKTIGSAWYPRERAALAALVAGDKRIRMIDADLPRDRLTALIGMSDCFVSLHRSEGFGRGPAEAMLLGKPVIATDYSGTRDFVSADTALPVGCRPVPVGRGEYPGGDGQVWAEPDIDEAAAAMRRVAGDPGLAARLGEAGRVAIAARYAPEVVGVQYLDRLTHIAGSLPPSRSAAQ